MSQVTNLISNNGSGGFVQTLTGNSGGPVSPTAGNINIVGTGTVTVTDNPATSTLTISVADGGIVWQVIVADQTAAVNNGYFCEKPTTLLLALPASSNVGDTIEITNEVTALGVQITQILGQQILLGNENTTLGAVGTLTSSQIGDTLKIVCKTANFMWRVTDVVGNWSVV